jgi:hypothetical protein
MYIVQSKEGGAEEMEVEEVRGHGVGTILVCKG